MSRYDWSMLGKTLGVLGVGSVIGVAFAGFFFSGHVVAFSSILLTGIVFCVVSMYIESR